MELGINRLAKPKAKRAVVSYLESLAPLDNLILFTDGSAHPEEGLGAAATTADGNYSKLCLLGPPGTASNFECKLVGI
jgi:hypothetical protein